MRTHVLKPLILVGLLCREEHASFERKTRRGVKANTVPVTDLKMPQRIVTRHGLRAHTDAICQMCGLGHFT